MIDPFSITGSCCHKCWTKEAFPESDEIEKCITFMIVCADCGNKRCPKATNHDNECTKSNDVMQPGSVYGGLV
jgi:hypothetical protein